MEKLIARLQRIARKNDDVFSYTVKIVPNKAGTLLYEFECKETSDEHCFVSSNGFTLEEVATNADKWVDDACEEWGYEQ